MDKQLLCFWLKGSQIFTSQREWSSTASFSHTLHYFKSVRHSAVNNSSWCAISIPLVIPTSRRRVVLCLARSFPGGNFPRQQACLHYTVCITSVWLLSSLSFNFLAFTPLILHFCLFFFTRFSFAGPVLCASMCGGINTDVNKVTTGSDGQRTQPVDFSAPPPPSLCVERLNSHI